MTNKRLYRSHSDRMIAGVCGGLGEYLNIDPTLIRLALALLTILGGGSGILIYFIAWLVIPEAPQTQQPAAPEAAPTKASEPPAIEQTETA